jgi:hypothetical protein
VGIVTAERNGYIVLVTDQIKYFKRLHRSLYLAPPPPNCNRYIAPVTCPQKKIVTITSLPLLVLPIIVTVTYVEFPLLKRLHRSRNKYKIEKVMSASFWAKKDGWVFKNWVGLIYRCVVGSFWVALAIYGYMYCIYLQSEPKAHSVEAPALLKMRFIWAPAPQH